jgi:hypothetical protein
MSQSNEQEFQEFRWRKRRKETRKESIGQFGLTLLISETLACGKR